MRHLTAKNNEMEDFYGPIASIFEDGWKKSLKSKIQAHVKERIESIGAASSRSFLLIQIDDSLVENRVKKEISLNDETHDVISEEKLGVYCAAHSSQDEIGKRERRYKDSILESQLKNRDQIGNTPPMETRSHDTKLERLRFWAALIIVATLFIIGIIFIILER